MKNQYYIISVNGKKLFKDMLQIYKCSCNKIYIIKLTATRSVKKAISARNFNR